jgi:LacI family transcriptional regulator
LAVTLAEIARQVGVHVSLVSRVLRNDASAKLSPAKREKILAVAKATGYRPNRLGRSLRTGHTSIIGMLTPDIQRVSRVSFPWRRSGGYGGRLRHDFM